MYQQREVFLIGENNHHYLINDNGARVFDLLVEDIHTGMISRGLEFGATQFAKKIRLYIRDYKLVTFFIEHKPPYDNFIGISVAGNEYFFQGMNGRAIFEEKANNVMKIEFCLP